ncbi:hypothetical protein Tco_0710345 [Tanacetum coccineum]
MCLLCEEILKQIPTFSFIYASFESITAIEKHLEMVDAPRGGSQNEAEDVKLLIKIQARESSQSEKSWTINNTNTKTRVCEEGEPSTHRKTLIHYYTILRYKHGVPPEMRLFKVAMLDPSPEFNGPWGTSGDPGLPIVVRPLQSSASDGDHSL